ncbi:MAG: hypothetical protein P1U81_08500 [Verrucomicrobiales bacterium]|nr:hypothetical protein [Verrucomicrobiales bacterium]
MEQAGFSHLWLRRSSAISVLIAAGVFSSRAVAEIEVPAATGEEDFSALRRASPFVRVLNPAETYALRGVAQVDDVAVATLYNRETKKTFVVTPETASDEGIQLVEIERNRELEGVKARVSFAGEEVELVYDPRQFTVAPRGGSGGGEQGKGKGGDGEKRRGPSKEEMERYKALAPEKQKVFQEYIRHVMQTYPDMPREERGNLMRGALIRLSDGQELDWKPADSGGDR